VRSIEQPKGTLPDDWQSDFIARFIARTSHDGERMAALRAGLGGATRAAEDAIRALAHRVAGISGTLGFDRVGKAAGALDDLLATGCDAAAVHLSLDALLAEIAAIKSAGAPSQEFSFAASSEN
jgi:HPt (histidine-containing phosphotransfer) domain-containing protein